jgi:hypothetical protein
MDVPERVATIYRGMQPLGEPVHKQMDHVEHRQTAREDLVLRTKPLLIWLTAVLLRRQE